MLLFLVCGVSVESMLLRCEINFFAMALWYPAATIRNCCWCVMLLFLVCGVSVEDVPLRREF